MTVWPACVPSLHGPSGGRIPRHQPGTVTSGDRSPELDHLPRSGAARQMCRSHARHSVGPPRRAARRGGAGRVNHARFPAAPGEDRRGAAPGRASRPARPVMGCSRSSVISMQAWQPDTYTHPLPLSLVGSGRGTVVKRWHRVTPPEPYEVMFSTRHQ